MPKDKLTDYSSTNASNTDVGGVNIDEGMLPSGVNNAIREVLTHLKNFASGTDGIDVLSLADDDASAAMKIQAPASVTADTTLTLPDGDGSDGQALVTDGSGTLSWADVHSARNIVMNGAMTVWQRGTTDDTASVGDLMCDRWSIAFGGLDGNVDWDKETSSTPDGFSCAVKVSTDAAEASLDASDYIRITQKFEGQDLQHLQKGSANAKKVTLSFWVRSSVASTYTVELEDRDTASFRHIAKSYTVDTANTWEYKTITFDGDTTGAFNNDNGNSLNMHFWIDAGSTYSGGTFPEVWQARVTNQRVYDPTDWLEDTTSREFYLTGVQLTVGDVDLPFIHESYGETLRKCQRYFCKSYDDTTAVGTSTQTGAIYDRFPSTVSNRAVSVQFPVTMRTNPTVTLYSLNGTSGNVSDCNTGYSHSSNDTAGVSGTVGRNGFSKVSSVSNADVMAFHYTANAEL